MSFDAVRTALDTLMAATFVANVAYENAEYTPTVGTDWKRVTFLPTEPTQASLGTNGHNRLMGIYQVSVFAEVGKGPKAAEDAAELVITAFKRGTSLTAVGGVTTRIERAWRGPAIQESDWYHVPVSVSWFAYAAN